MSMKANELKVTDLMVGDLVLFEGTPAKISGIRICDEPCAQTNLHDIWFVVGFEPIPLTSEILEKNGFERNEFIPHYNSIDNRVSLHNDKEYMNSVNEWHVHIDSEDYCSIANCELTHVHELQHILRLCKIDKEIVV